MTYMVLTFGDRGLPAEKNMVPYPYALIVLEIPPETLFPNYLVDPSHQPCVCQVLLNGDTAMIVLVGSLHGSSYLMYLGESLDIGNIQYHTVTFLFDLDLKPQGRN